MVFYGLHLLVKVGPLGDLSDMPTEELQARLDDVRAQLSLDEFTEKAG